MVEMFLKVLFWLLIVSNNSPIIFCRHPKFNLSSMFCPETCTCVRKAPDVWVSCLEGGLNDRMFARLMSKIPDDVSVLKIIGPKIRPNRFTITQDFERFRSLNELHLINCRIPSLGKRTFENVKNLRSLNLAENQIEILSPEMFTNTEHLTYLNLSSNFLNKTVLPTGAFAHLSNLEILDLSDNRLEYFTTTNLFGGLTKLRTLKLDKNLMNDQSFHVLLDLPNLETLSLNDCQLNDVPPAAFQKNPSLRVLSLRNNKLRSTYMAATKNVPRLEFLDLSGNLITSISDSTFRHTDRLSKLILANNYVGATMNDKYLGSKVTLVRQPLAHAFGENLYELDLSNNSINSFKSRYIEPFGRNLKVLHLSNNKLGQVTREQTKNMNSLVELYLSNAQITALPDALPDEYRNLEVLDLSNNSLSTFNIDQTNSLQRLYQLNLAGNNFSKLYDYQRYFLMKLNRLNFDGNPWQCENCRTITNLQALLDSGKFRNPDDGEFHCATPGELSGQKIQSVIKFINCPKIYGAIAELSPQSEVGLLVGGVCALLLVITLTTAVVCCYYWNRPRAVSSSACATASAYNTPQNAEETVTLSSTNSDQSQSIQPSLRDLSSLRRDS